MKKIALITLFIFLVGLVSAMTGDITAFIDIPSMLLVTISVFIGLFSKCGLKFYEKSGEEISAVVGISALYSGVLGFLIGLIQMLQNLSDPAAIGPAMAVCLLTSLYGLLIFICCYFSSSDSKFTFGALFFPIFFVASALGVNVLMIISFSLEA